MQNYPQIQETDKMDKFLDGAVDVAKEVGSPVIQIVRTLHQVASAVTTEEKILAVAKGASGYAVNKVMHMETSKVIDIVGSTVVGAKVTPVVVNSVVAPVIGELTAVGTVVGAAASAAATTTVGAVVVGELTAVGTAVGGAASAAATALGLGSTGGTLLTAVAAVNPVVLGAVAIVGIGMLIARKLGD